MREGSGAVEGELRLQGIAAEYDGLVLERLLLGSATTDRQ